MEQAFLHVLDQTDFHQMLELSSCPAEMSLVSKSP